MGETQILFTVLLVYLQDLLERLQPNIKRCETFDEAAQAVAALEAAEAKAQAAGGSPPFWTLFSLPAGAARHSGLVLSWLAKQGTPCYTWPLGMARRIASRDIAAACLTAQHLGILVHVCPHKLMQCRFRPRGH